MPLPSPHLLDPRLATAIFWIAVASCVVGQIAIIRSTMVSSLSDSTEHELPRPRRFAEVAWTVLPALGLAALLYFTWRAVNTGTFVVQVRPIADAALRLWSAV